MKRSYIIILIATICLIFGFTISQYLYIKPVSAQTAIHSSSIFEMSGDRRLIAASQNGLVSKVNQTVTDNGITLTINDVYYFGNQISYSYTIETKKPINVSDIKYKFHDSVMASPKITFNNKLNFGSYTWFKKVSDHKYVGGETINPTKQLSKDGILEITYYRVLANQGKWSFHFPIKEVQGKEIKLSTTKNYKGYKIKIKSVKMDPAEIAVSFEVKQKIDGEHIWFNLLKDDGTALKLLDLFGGASQKDINEKKNTITHKLVYKFSVPSSNAKDLTLSPYIEPDIKLPKIVTKDLDVNQLPITVDQGEVGKLIITNVEYKQDKIFLYYKDEITYPYDSVRPGSNIWLEDNSQKNVSDRYIVTNLLGKTKPLGSGNSYVTEFHRTKPENQSLKIASRLYPLPHIIKKLQIKIPLDN